MFKYAPHLWREKLCMRRGAYSSKYCMRQSLSSQLVAFLFCTSNCISSILFLGLHEGIFRFCAPATFDVVQPHVMLCYESPLPTDDLIDLLTVPLSDLNLLSVSWKDIFRHLGSKVFFWGLLALSSFLIADEWKNRIESTIRLFSLLNSSYAWKKEILCPYIDYIMTRVVFPFNFKYYIKFNLIFLLL